MFSKKLIYNTLDLLKPGGFNKKIGNSSVKLAAKWYRYYNRPYETENIYFARDYIFPDDIVVDIGAHIGLYTVWYSGLVGPNGKVLAFEPSKATYQQLLHTIKLNGSHNVKTINMAVSDTAGVASFFSPGNPGGVSNTLIPRTDISLMDYKVSVVALDDYLSELNRINFIKLDAEGAELRVLRGAKQIIMRDRPKIILGVHPKSLFFDGSSLSDLWDMVQSYGYLITYAFKGVEKSWFLSRNEPFDVHLIPLV